MSRMGALPQGIGPDGLTSRRPRASFRLIAGGAALSLIAGVTACAAPRSLEAYCGVIEEHKDRYLGAMSEVNAAADPLSGLAGMVSALGDLSRMWEEAADAAPEEIRTDVEAVRDAWAEQFDAAEQMADNPLAGLAAGLVSGLANAGAVQRVDEYTALNCPGVGGMFGTPPTQAAVAEESSPAAAERPTTSPDTSWKDAEPLTLLGNVGDYDKLFGNDDLLITIASGEVHSFLPDGTPVGTYQGLLEEEYADQVGMTVLSAWNGGFVVVTDDDGVPHAYGLMKEESAAQGLIAATTTYSLVSLSPELEIEWVVPLSTIADDEDVFLDFADLVVSATSDGSAIVAVHSYVVPETQAVHNEKGVRMFPLGRFVATGYLGSDDITVYDPTTGEAVFSGMRTTNYDSLEPADLLYEAGEDRSEWGIFAGDETAVMYGGLVSLPDGAFTPLPFSDNLPGSLSTPMVDLVSRTIVDGSGSAGISLDTAEVRWDLQDAGSYALCAAGSGQALIGTRDDQLVLLDAATGEQIDYLPGTGSCPQMVGTIGVLDDGSVYQVLKSDRAAG